MWLSKTKNPHEKYPFANKVSGGNDISKQRPGIDIRFFLALTELRAKSAGKPVIDRIGTAHRSGRMLGLLSLAGLCQMCHARLALPAKRNDEPGNQSVGKPSARRWPTSPRSPSLGDDVSSPTCGPRRRHTSRSGHVTVDSRLAAYGASRCVEPQADQPLDRRSGRHVCRARPVP